jgi:hypothetical protein
VSSKHVFNAFRSQRSFFLDKKVAAIGVSPVHTSRIRPKRQRDLTLITHLPVSMKAMKRPVKHEEIADHQLNPLMFRIPALKNRKSSRSNLQQANGGWTEITENACDPTEFGRYHRMMRQTGRLQRRQEEGGDGLNARCQRFSK